MATNKTYNNQVFINCPFDLEYINLYRASIFSIIGSGFFPRCSREINNGNKTRIDNIVQLIRECRYGIHDLSRVELDINFSLPRFNMPFEYGVFYGSQHFGDEAQKKKCSLVLEKEEYRYQKFLSDISGIDVTAHNNSIDKIILKIRDWLHTSSKRKNMPTGEEITEKFYIFEDYMVNLCQRNNRNYVDMPYKELVQNMTDWLKYSYEKDALDPDESSTL